MLQRDFEFRDIYRFGHKRERALTDGIDRHLALGLPGDDDDFDERFDREQLGEGCEAFGGLAGSRWQTQVKQHHGRALGLERLDGGATIFRQANFIILAQSPLHLGTYLFVIIDDQQPGFHAASFSIGNNTRNVVPSPGWLSTSILPSCASTTILLKNMPIPMPFFLVVWNGRNSDWFMNSTLMPHPLSVTDTV